MIWNHTYSQEWLQTNRNRISQWNFPSCNTAFPGCRRGDCRREEWFGGTNISPASTGGERTNTNAILFFFFYLRNLCAPDHTESLYVPIRVALKPRRRQKLKITIYRITDPTFIYLAIHSIKFLLCTSTLWQTSQIPFSILYFIWYIHTFVHF